MIITHVHHQLFNYYIITPDISFFLTQSYLYTYIHIPVDNSRIEFLLE